jgi:diguanylate cyclase (GGDEF)-like protein
VARVRGFYAAASVVLVAVYYTLTALRPVTVLLIGALAVGAIEYGVRRARPQRHGAWRTLALTLVLLAVGDSVFLVMQAHLSHVPYPSWPDLFYVAAYAPLTIGLLWLGRPVAVHRDQTNVIDAVAFTLAGSLIVWILVIVPAVKAHNLSVLARSAAVAGWVGYVAVFAAAVLVVLSWRRNTSVRLLALAAVAFLVAEIFYGHELLLGSWVAGGWVDAGYFAFGLLCGAAALHPTMADIASPGHVRYRLGPGRLALIAIGLLVAPTALLVEASLGAVTTGVAIAVVSAVVSILMVVRLWLTARAAQRRAARERAARIASRSMVRAATPEEVVAGTRDAIASVLPARHTVDVRLVDTRAVEPPVAVAGNPPAVVVRPDGVGEVALPLTGQQADLVVSALATELFELSGLLETLADQAALALNRISLIEQDRIEERERYFRTLVDTSTDVILISRNCRIGYATPSARAMFGRDVTGDCFDEIVRPMGDVGPQWPDTVDAGEGRVLRAGGETIVVVHRRDLTDDPTVRGIVTTMRDVTAERALQRDLAYRATHDELTGLANGRMWSWALADEEDRRRRQGRGTAILFIDLDDFKSVNDAYGHVAGDMVLAEVGRRILDSVRAEDLAARVGGDEFAVLVRGVPTVDDARAVAQRVAEELARPASVDGDTVDCRASIGLAYTEQREPVRGLTGNADAALYVAKAGGKGTWREYAPGMPIRRRPLPGGHTPDSRPARRRP